MHVSLDFQVFFPASTSNALSNEDEGFHQNLGMVSSTPKKSGGFFPDFTPEGTTEVSPIECGTHQLQQADITSMKTSLQVNDSPPFSESCKTALNPNSA